jgi:hypothetical protein
MAIAIVARINLNDPKEQKMTTERAAVRPSATVEELIGNKQYKEALRLAKEEARRRPGDHRLLTLCADIYVLLRKEERAVEVLKHVADFHAATGSPAKAVAVLKKIQRIGYDDATLYESIATRIKQERAQETPLQYAHFALAEDEEFETTAVMDIVPGARESSEIRVVEDQVVDQAVPSPLFDDFSREELLAFMKGLQLQLFDPGDIIVAQGEPGHSLFILTTGIVKAFVRHRDHHHHHVRTLHDGDFFGEISILSGRPRTATITAATRCELLELDRTTLDSITAAHPHVKDVMQRFYDERVASDRSLDAQA